MRTVQITAIISALVLLLSLAAISYLSPPPSVHPSEQQAATQPDKKQTEEAHTIQGFIRYLFPDGIAVFTFWLVIATIVLGVVAVVQIGFLERAEIISANAAKAAKDSVEIAQASFIVANRPQITVDATQELHATDFKGLVTQLKLVLSNVGHSPARRVQIRAKALYKPSETSIQQVQREFCAELKADATQTGLVVHPGSPVTRVATAITPRDFLEGRLKEGNDSWGQRVLVCVTYDFEATRKTYVLSFVVQFPQIKITHEGMIGGVQTNIPDLKLFRPDQFEFSD